jgi:hypothetical protein
LCSYESLRRDTAATFEAALRFLEGPIDPQAVAFAVDESSFDKLRSRERSNRAWDGRSVDQDAFRFRRGTVGGHADELAEPDVAYLDAVVAQHLDTVFSDYVLPRRQPLAGG